VNRIVNLKLELECKSEKIWRKQEMQGWASQNGILYSTKQGGGGGGTRNPQQKAIPFCLVSAAIQFAEIYFQEDWKLKKWKLLSTNYK
jgi:hypothetical protein